MSGPNLNLEFCCTCLKVSAEDDKFLSLGFTPPEDISFQTKLKSCVPEMGLKNTEDCYLCQPCSVALETAYTFRCMCLRSESKLEEFLLSHKQKCMERERDIKFELIESAAMEEISEEIIIETEEKYVACLSTESEDAQPEEVELDYCVQPEDTNPSSVSAQSDEQYLMDTEIVDVEEVESDKLACQPEQRSALNRDSRIELVKDELGNLLTESLEGGIDSIIHIFDEPLKQSEKVTREDSIFSSLNAEIEELSKNAYLQPCKLPGENATAVVKGFDSKSPAPPLQSKRLSDAEILKIACKTIPDLHNCPVQTLQCQVTLENITVSKVPVKIPSEKSPPTLSKPKGRIFRCPVCGKDILRRNRFNGHILRHSNIRAYKCNRCSERFFSDEALGRHRKICTGVSDTTKTSTESSASQAEVAASKNESSPAAVNPKPPAVVRRLPGTTPKATSLHPKQSKTSPKLTNPTRKKKRKLQKLEEGAKKRQKTAARNNGVNPKKTEVFAFKYKRTGNNIRRSTRKQTLAKRLSSIVDPVFRCELCVYQTYAKQKYQVHMLKHGNVRDFECSECSKKFYEKWELNRHIRNFHPSLVAAKQAESHGYIFKAITKKVKKVTGNPKSERQDSSSLQKTAKSPITVTVDQGIVVTPIIQSIHSLAETPLEHVPVQMSFSCKVCDISFRSRNLLNLHTQTHELRHSCETCSEEFISEQQYAEHIQIHHPANHEVELESSSSVEPQLPPKLPMKKKKKKYFCTVCKLEFSSRDHANIHTGAKPYKCKYCSKHFAAYNTVRKHHLTHMDHRKTTPSSQKSGAVSQRRKYACNICKKEFVNKDYVLSHTCHNASGETVYRCQICKNPFIGRTALIEHMGIHVSQNVSE